MRRSHAEKTRPSRSSTATWAPGGGQVVAPGATILRAGEAPDEEAPIEPGDLVAIEKDGVIFFYHPLAGDAPLSLETSRLSVGYFVAGLTSDSAGGEAAGALTLRPDGVTVCSDTGVEFSLRTAGARVSARNTGNRWAALTTDRSLTPYYPLPTSTPLPTNIVDAFLSDVRAAGASTDSRSDIEAGRELAVHGAVPRALPLLIFSDNIETARQSRAADPALFANVALHDLAHLVVNGFQSFIGLFPIECVDALVTSTLKSRLDAYINEYLDGAWGRDALHVIEIEADGRATAVADRPLTFGRGLDVSGSRVFTAGTARPGSAANTQLTYTPR